MGRALIVSAGASSNEYISARLTELGYARPLIVPSAAEARRRMLESDFELIDVEGCCKRQTVAAASLRRAVAVGLGRRVIEGQGELRHPAHRRDRQPSCLDKMSDSRDCRPAYQPRTPCQFRIRGDPLASFTSIVFEMKGDFSFFEIGKTQYAQEHLCLFFTLVSRRKSNLHGLPGNFRIAASCKIGRKRHILFHNERI